MQFKTATYEIQKSSDTSFPLLKTQREIVARLETERAIVHGNRELIRFASREEKVKKVIERVWES